MRVTGLLVVLLLILLFFFVAPAASYAQSANSVKAAVSTDARTHFDRARSETFCAAMARNLSGWRLLHDAHICRGAG